MRWRWKMMRISNVWESFLHRFSATRRATAYRNKICPGCGALLDRNEKVCPHCGGRGGNARLQSIQRGARTWLPAEGSVTAVLLALNCALYLWGGVRYGMGHLFSPTGKTLFVQGALIPPLAFKGAWWGMFTYGFVHGGILHIFFNMMVLYQVGPSLEKAIGSARFYCVYTLALLGGALADVWLRHTPVPVVGASGALFGLIGFGIAYGHSQGGQNGHQLRSFFTRWAMYALIFGLLMPGIDNIVHGGGLVVGLLLGFPIEKELRYNRGVPVLWNLLSLILALATLVAFITLYVYSLKTAV